MTLQPAYGRDYKNKAAVEKDFRDGKDFVGDVTMGFKYCSIRDIPKGTIVELRYNQLRSAVCVTI